jgi:hypothetical protein
MKTPIFLRGLFPNKATKILILTSNKATKIMNLTSNKATKIMILQLKQAFRRIIFLRISFSGFTL